jgi:hypothetical protein
MLVPTHQHMVSQPTRPQNAVLQHFGAFWSKPLLPPFPLHSLKSVLILLFSPPNRLFKEVFPQRFCMHVLLPTACCTLLALTILREQYRPITKFLTAIFFSVPCLSNLSYSVWYFVLIYLKSVYLSRVKTPFFTLCKPYKTCFTCQNCWWYLFIFSVFFKEDREVTVFNNKHFLSFVQMNTSVVRMSHSFHLDFPVRHDWDN